MPVQAAPGRDFCHQGDLHARFVLHHDRCAPLTHTLLACVWRCADPVQSGLSKCLLQRPATGLLADIRQQKLLCPWLAEGKVVTWLKQEGDPVSKGEVRWGGGGRWRFLGPLDALQVLHLHNFSQRDSKVLFAARQELGPMLRDEPALVRWMGYDADERQLPECAAQVHAVGCSR